MEEKENPVCQRNPEQNRVLFVDDEPNLLSSLKRLLRPMRDTWFTSFALGGDEGLRQVREECFDVVISDMRMPGMDGAEFLEEVRLACPATVRLILSGQSDDEAILKALQCSHQYVSKPCEIETLSERVHNACHARELIPSVSVQEVVSGLCTIAIDAEQYERICSLLKQGEPDQKEVVTAIAQDIAASAKVLQIANSDYFRRGREVLDVNSAADHLGVTILRKLFLDSSVFVPVRSSGEVLRTKALNLHSYKVAERARFIAQLENLSEREQNYAFTAGMLHEIGRLVFVTSFHEEYQKVGKRILEGGLSHYEAEREVFGCTHSEVGAYLLALWGLPSEIIEAVTFQSNPSECPHREFRILAILHAANALEDSLGTRESHFTFVGIDNQYLCELNKQKALSDWKGEVKKES